MGRFGLNSTTWEALEESKRKSSHPGNKSIEKCFRNGGSSDGADSLTAVFEMEKKRKKSGTPPSPGVAEEGASKLFAKSK